MNIEFAFGFFNSPADIAIVAGVVVLLFGGKQIPVFFKSLGDGMKEFKKATKEMQDEGAQLADAHSSAPQMMESTQPAAAKLPLDGTPHTAEAVAIPTAAPAPAPAPVTASKE